MRSSKNYVKKEYEVEIKPSKNYSEKEWKLALVEYYLKREDDQHAAFRKIMPMFEKLIISCINKYYKGYKKVLYDDLRQCCYQGIIENLDKYNIKISKPSTFFYIHMRHNMYVFISEYYYGTTVHYNNCMTKIKRYRQECKDLNIKNPSMDEISKAIDVSVVTVEHTLEVFKNWDNIVEYVDIKSKAQEVIYNKSPEDIAVSRSIITDIEDACKTLTLEENKVFQSLYHDELAIKEVASLMGCSRSKIEDLRNSALNKLREVPQLRSYWEPCCNPVNQKIYFAGSFNKPADEAEAISFSA